MGEGRLAGRPRGRDRGARDLHVHRQHVAGAAQDRAGEDLHPVSAFRELAARPIARLRGRGHLERAGPLAQPVELQHVDRRPVLREERRADGQHARAGKLAGGDATTQRVGVARLRGDVEDGGESPAQVLLGQGLRQFRGRAVGGTGQRAGDQVDVAVPVARHHRCPGRVDALGIGGNGKVRAHRLDPAVADEHHAAFDRFGLGRGEDARIHDRQRLCLGCDRRQCQHRGKHPGQARPAACGHVPAVLCSHPLPVRHRLPPPRVPPQTSGHAWRRSTRAADQRRPWLSATLPRISAPASAMLQVTASPSSHQAQATPNSGTR